MGKPLQNIVLVIGSFLVTFALLVTGWMVATGTPAATASPTPSVAPTVAPVVSLAPVTPTPPRPETPTPEPTPTSTPAPATPTPTTTFSPPPMRTPPPSGEPLPSTLPGSTQTIVVAGNSYISADVPSHGRLLNTQRGALLETSRDSSDALWVTYDLPAESLPAGAVVHSVDVRICGVGEGDFWEVYGPPGGEPFEYEVIAPAADGCWHFSDAPPGDMTVIAAVMLQSRLLIESVEYTITFGQ